MKRLLILILCAMASAWAISACGGGDGATAADKLTIVGAGS